MGIKDVKKQLTGMKPLQHHEVVQETQKRCEQMKGQECGESDSEEEDHVWKPVSLDLKDRKVVIDSINDEQYDWSKMTKDGKESNFNFHGWVDSIAGQLYTIHVKNHDNELFE
jgi:hypothetical protein